MQRQRHFPEREGGGKEIERLRKTAPFLQHRATIATALPSCSELHRSRHNCLSLLLQSRQEEARLFYPFLGSEFTLNLATWLTYVHTPP